MGYEQSPVPPSIREDHEAATESDPRFQLARVIKSEDGVVAARWATFFDATREARITASRRKRSESSARQSNPLGLDG